MSIVAAPLTRLSLARCAPLAVALALAGAGCASSGEDFGRESGEVVGGSVTMEHPEIGSISGCTATLIAPNVVITAAHCLSYSSRTSPGRYGSFTIRRSSSDRRSFTIQRYRSYASSVGRDDIALIQLASDVPADYARPAPLADANPSTGSTLTVYGYGCTRRGSGTDWQKRRYSFAMGSATSNLCPGDSGGPVLTASGAVLRINSGYWLDSRGNDIFGEVPRNYDRLMAQVREWSSGPVPPPAPEGDAGSPPPPPPGADAGAGTLRDAGMSVPDDFCQPLASSCGGCTPIRGCGWCAATSTCTEVDRSGAPIRGCSGGFALNPSDCSSGGVPPGGGDSCGVYGPFPEYTCRRTSTGFARCRPGSTPEFLVCPSGYYCSPGSRTLMCYRR